MPVNKIIQYNKILKSTCPEHTPEHKKYGTKRKKCARILFNNSIEYAMNK